MPAKRSAFQISEKHRALVRWSARTVTAVGIILSFISLPVVAAGTITIISCLILALLERIGYYKSILHIAPIPSDYVIQNKFGNLWDVDDFTNIKKILILYVAPAVNSLQVTALVSSAATIRRSKRQASIHRRLAR
ncbi:MAG: hypothetical protein HY287_06975 [Planctomycetes bacterium]|nr:hypothetical protein [Planctomycetota bacterium]MBI3834057.1 hypothetical protein [Planctomycetota bacterium]